MPDFLESLDRVDQRILNLLQQDARRTVSEIAALVNLSTSPCWRRMKALEEAGLIEGYHARLSRQRLGWPVHGFVHLQLDNHSAEVSGQFEAQVLEIDQVLACHNLSGHFDYQLEVVARSLEEFAQLVRDKLRTLPAVREISTSFTLREIKGGRHLPL